MKRSRFDGEIHGSFIDRADEGCTRQHADTHRSEEELLSRGLRPDERVCGNRFFDERRSTCLMLAD
jgi:hypothetical protein